MHACQLVQPYFFFELAEIFSMESLLEWLFLNNSTKNDGKFDKRYRVYFFVQGQMSNITVFMKWENINSECFACDQTQSCRHLLFVTFYFFGHFRDSEVEIVCNVENNSY